MLTYRIHTGVVLPFDRINVDTDTILPKQYMKTTTKSGLGPFLFDTLRYVDAGDLSTPIAQRRLNNEFILNDPRYRSATVLLARDNFGTGSSREHAVWALKDYGFNTIIAPSFGTIFEINCFKNGVLPIRLPNDSVECLFAEKAGSEEQYMITVNLAEQYLDTTLGTRFEFNIDPHYLDNLLNGRDEISSTLGHSNEIKNFENERMRKYPWLVKTV